jgi:hypothetical protein
MKRFASVLLLASTQHAIGQSVLSVDPALQSAEIAGYWAHGDSNGSYRILVFSGGYEHVSNWVVAEWVETQKGNYDSASVVHSKQLVGPGFFVFDAPILTQPDGYVRVELKGADTHDPERKISCTFELFPDGEVKQVKACD